MDICHNHIAFCDIYIVFLAYNEYVYANCKKVFVYSRLRVRFVGNSMAYMPTINSTRATCFPLDLSEKDCNIHIHLYDYFRLSTNAFHNTTKIINKFLFIYLPWNNGKFK